jgi:hypothetical protein
MIIITFRVLMDMLSYVFSGSIRSLVWSMDINFDKGINII